MQVYKINARKIVYFVENEHKIMSDSGYSMQELCAVIVTNLNKPNKREFATNFDIAVTRINVKRIIGRIRV